MRLRHLALMLLLAAMMILAAMPAASAHGFCDDGGRSFGAFHSQLAQQDGPMGQVHKPGLAHGGYAGACLGLGAHSPH